MDIVLYIISRHFCFMHIYNDSSEILVMIICRKRHILYIRHQATNITFVYI